MNNPWLPSAFGELLETEGVHEGCFAAPSSRNSSAWGAQLVRCSIFSSGVPGPTLLVSSGIHGDELEGPVGLSRLLKSPESIIPIRGSVAFLPIANPDAYRECARHSPADGANLNRLFGRPEALATTASEALQALLSELLSASDALLDLHSGGRSLEFVPCAMWHDCEALVGAEASRRLAFSMDLPLAVPIRSQEADGTFDNLAARQGKTAVAIELGGGSYLRSENFRRVELIVGKAMACLGIGRYAEAASSTTSVDWPSLVYAFDDGVVEFLCTLGESVSAGKVIALLHTRVGQRGYRAREIVSPSDGIVVALRSIAAVQSGDTMIAVSQKSMI